MGALMDGLRKTIDAALRRDRQAFLDCFTDDCEYVWHVGKRPLIGKEWLAKFLDRYWAEMADNTWVVDRFAENGNVLMAEGCETYVIKATGAKVVHPYMGVYEFRDGKIAKMRDYYDMGNGAT